MARKKTTESKAGAGDPVAAKDAPSTTEEATAQVEKSQAGIKVGEPGPLVAEANERGFLGTVPEAGIEATKNADLRSGTAEAPPEKKK